MWCQVLKVWINYQGQGLSVQPKNRRLEVLELVALFLLKTETCDAKNSWEFFLDAILFCLVKIGFQTGSRDAISCLLPCVLYCMEVKLSMLSWNIVWALRTTTTNCRVSFIDLYLVFFTKCRVVFLPHKNTVILLQHYCGTITKFGLPVFLLQLKCMEWP